MTATLADLSAALAASKLSSVELTRRFLERIKALNPRLNSFIALDEERSLAQAARSRSRARGGRRAGR